MTVQTETDRNYDAFISLLPNLIREHSGDFALLHDCEIVEYFGSSIEAVMVGARKFGIGAFSVQEVTDGPEHLGFYSCVGGSGDY